MNDDKSCGCDVGALAYADDVEVIEPDLVLDDPEDDEMRSVRRVPRAVGAFSLVDDTLLALDADELGFFDTALDLGLKLGKKVVDVVTAPSKSKAKQAQRTASAASKEAAALKAELDKAKAREEKQKRQQQVADERRRNQAHEREKRDLEERIKELEQQKLLVQREVGKKAAEAREAEQKAEEKERLSFNRKLAIGGGVAATSLLAVWALSRRPKDRDEEAKRGAR